MHRNFPDDPCAAFHRHRHRLAAGERRGDRDDREMNRINITGVLLAAILWWISPAAAQTESSRAAALDYLGRGTAGFRAGDIVSATRNWSEAIRLCRLNGASDLEAQALARRGETYRVEGYFRDASSDLQAALTKAEQSGDQALVAAASGAHGNVAEEVAAVHEIEGGDELLNDQFSRARFEAELRRVPYSVVHIASHGQFGNDPSQTFVLAFDGRLTMDDLERSIKFGSAATRPWNC